MAQAAARSMEPAPEPNLEQLFRLHASRVIAAAYRVTGNAQDAEDVLQTVFLRLAGRQGGPALTAELGPYLRRAAVNAGLDVMRSRRSSRATPLDEIQTPMADVKQIGPEQAQGSREIRDQVRLALADQSPRSAEIFALRYFEGYDNQEIARIVGSSPSAVAVILHRTRARLRDAIGPYVGERS